MKKIILLCLFCSMLTLTGCNEDVVGDELVNVGDSMVKIDCETGLFYRKDTRVIYIILSQSIYPDSQSGRGYGYMAPYISENGKYCIYNDGEIQEIE